MQKNPKNDTIVALSSAWGPSAIALIRITGPLSEKLSRTVFEPQQDIDNRVSKVGYYQLIDGSLLDQCAYTFFAGPRTFTGEHMLEIHPHGNPLIVNKLINDLLARGCRLAGPGEFARRSFENGKIDLTQAEAICSLITAKSERALTLAQRQLQGALGKRVETLSEQLIDIIAKIEAYIDFPEEGLPEETTDGPLKELRTIVSTINGILKNYNFTALLAEGIKTVIVGAPNAGKSSLLNYLVGEERALVTALPGTTRDYIVERIIISPYSLQLVDTAGLRETNCPIEQAGIGRTIKQVDKADLFLWVIDLSEPFYPLPDPIIDQLKPECTLVIGNKIDKKIDASHQGRYNSYPYIEISLETGEKTDALVNLIKEIIDKNLKLPDAEDFLINARHAAAFESIKKHLLDALKNAKEGIGAEFIASDLRFALQSLGEIVGKIDNEAILDRLFGAFCIGK